MQVTLQSPLRFVPIVPILVVQQQRHVCRGPLAEVWHFQASGGRDFGAGVSVVDPEVVALSSSWEVGELPRQEVAQCRNVVAELEALGRGF